MLRAHQHARARTFFICPRTHENWVQHPMVMRARIRTHTCISTHAHVGVNEAIELNQISEF